jgi:hypothetical protein
VQIGRWDDRLARRIESVGVRELTDDDVQVVLRSLRAEHLEGAEELDRVGERERAAVLRRQAEIRDTYLA